jgi:hypothetical protein
MAGNQPLRGRDPIVAVTFEEVVENARIGLVGEITAVRDLLTGFIKSLRVHDGVTPGGAVFVAAANGGAAAVLPPALVVPGIAAVIVAANDSFTINHTLGYNPMVQVLDSTGAPYAGVQITYDDADNVTLVFAAAGSYTVTLR